MYKIDNLQPILEIQRKVFVNPPQYGDTRAIVLLLYCAMHINNAEGSFRQLAAYLMVYIFLQPLSTHNWCCISVTANKKSNSFNFEVHTNFPRLELDYPNKKRGECISIRFSPFNINEITELTN